MSLTGLRLPTEAEWEYACRAGTTSAFHNGLSNPSTLGDIAWFSGNSDSQTHPVGQKASNALGFHDMLGNVWEWVNDWYGGYSAASQTNPAGPTSGSHYVVRAGSWLYDASSVNSARRFPNLPNQADPGGGVGFRVARNP